MQLIGQDRKFAADAPFLSIVANPLAVRSRRPV